MATPLDVDSQAAINAGSLQQMRQLVAGARDFVTRVYLPDLLAIASFYPDWAGHGRSVGNYLVYGEYPEADGANAPLFFPSGVIRGRDRRGLPRGAARRARPHRERKPLKYPVMFRRADLVVVTKLDLLPLLPEFRLDLLRENLAHVMPEPACIALSARSGEGLDAWIRWLENARVEASGPRAVAESIAQDRSI